MTVPADKEKPHPHMLKIGGVMRCCVETWEVRATTGAPPTEGERLPCKYCSSGLIYKDGAWEWDRA